ncbi:MAG: tryptophan synthase subunit alpha [Lachnospiraceae bacterium]|nr:tryptophan synthase subunit alpha [Lachnospiraceae bacterium]
MNQLNRILTENQETGKKLMVLRMEQKALQSAPADEVVSILKEKKFGGISLICTDALAECLKLAEELACRQQMPVILETGFHKVLKYGIADFAKAAASAGISGIRIPDLPFEEQGQLAVYLLDEDGPFLIREITPASGDRIIQNMQYARGFVWCSSEGNTEFLSGLEGDPLIYYLYAVEAAATRPVLLDFGNRYYSELQEYLNSADGAIVGRDLIETFRRDGYSSRLLSEFCGRFEL